jgi:hypothetical protein
MREKMDSKMSTKRYNQVKKMETETQASGFGLQRPLTGMN